MLACNFCNLAINERSRREFHIQLLRRLAGFVASFRISVARIYYSFFIFFFSHLSQGTVAPPIAKLGPPFQLSRSRA